MSPLLNSKPQTRDDRLTIVEPEPVSTSNGHMIQPPLASIAPASKVDSLLLGLPTERIIDPDFGDITDDVIEVLNELIEEERREAEREQMEAAQLGILDCGYSRGLQSPDMRIMPGVYWHWFCRENRDNNHWGKETINPWHHEEFRNDLKRDNPELRTRVDKPMDRVSFAGSEIPK
ncbi:MAG: hypothetical protein AAFX93_19895 [Verrucomicrobiota bacterium]